MYPLKGECKMKMSELRSAKKRRWDETLNNVVCVWVLPTDGKHDSGWACMEFVARTADKSELVRFGGGCDVVCFSGKHFRMDCDYDEKIIRIHNSRKKFSVTHDLSTIEFIE